MKYLVGIFLAALSLNVLSAANSVKGKITSVEARSSGYHAVYFDKEIPDQGCTRNDRAIIEGAKEHAATLTNIALAAFNLDTTIVIQVAGCVKIYPSSTSTAPRITKLQIYR